MREVQLGDLDVLKHDVLPNIHLGPVGDREHADVLAHAVTTVVQVPELGTLVLGVPLTEVIAEREDAFFGACFFFVTACPAEQRIKPVGLDRIKQCWNLRPVSRRERSRIFRRDAFVNQVLDLVNDQSLAELFDELVAEVERFGEVVSRVDMHERERELRGTERLLREVHHHDRVLASREHERGTLELRSHFAHDVDRLGFERLEVRQFVVGAGIYSLGHTQGLRLKKPSIQTPGSD